MTGTTARRLPKITERGLDELRQRIGVKIHRTLEPWCREVTRDNICHYAHGIGDDGFLRKASCRIRRHNLEGDTLRINGTVVRKFVENGRYLVEITQEARNLDGELSVVGGGIVELPARA